MATFQKANLALVFQPIGKGPKTWQYWDTGLLIADIQEVEGFITVGHDMGMRKGDRIFITEGDTGLYSDTGDDGGRRQYAGTITKSQDTGVTQTTVGLCVLIGDTS